MSEHAIVVRSVPAYRFRVGHDGQRHKVVVEDGFEGYFSTVTLDCSGCTEIEEGEVRSQAGCSECGYTGKRRSRFFVPFDIDAYSNHFNGSPTEASP